MQMTCIVCLPYDAVDAAQEIQLSHLDGLIINAAVGKWGEGSFNYAYLAAQMVTQSFSHIYE